MLKNRLNSPNLFRSVLILCVCAGALYGIGSLRQPADLTRPMHLKTPPQHAAITAPTLKVGVFNIHGCKGLDGKRDINRTAKYINDIDFMVLHEVRAGYSSNQADELGELLGMSSLFAPTEWRWGRHDFGNGLLTNVKLLDVHQIPLVKTEHTYRNALLTNFQFGEVTVQVLVAHIDLHGDRDRQVRAVSNLFMSLQEPAMLLGDLNVVATDKSLRELLEQPGVVNALASYPEHGHDWIITRGFRTVSGRVTENDASDHAVIQAELALDQPTRLAKTPESNDNP